MARGSPSGDEQQAPLRITENEAKVKLLPHHGAEVKASAVVKTGARSPPE